MIAKCALVPGAGLHPTRDFESSQRVAACSNVSRVGSIRSPLPLRTTICACAAFASSRPPSTSSGLPLSTPLREAQEGICWACGRRVSNNDQGMPRCAERGELREWPRGRVVCNPTDRRAGRSLAC